MAGTVKPGGKIALFVILAVGIFFGTKWYMNRPKEVGELVNVGKVSLPDAPEASLSGTNAVKLPIPSTTQSLNGGMQAKVLEMCWAAQTALNLANGGDRTTKGSLFDNSKLDITLFRQDDDGKSQQDIAAWIKQYHDNPSGTPGLFIVDMGSQMDSYLKTINDLVDKYKYTPDYKVVIFDAVGKSWGEDQLIGDIKYKHSPQTLKGAILRGVRLGGDLDIGIKFAGDNNIRVNTNDKLYYSDALNLSYGNDFLSVVNDYNTHKTETRKLVINGVNTKRDTTVEIDLVATWSPGDVNAIVGDPKSNSSPRGGATIISTHDYASIMPAVVIGCKKFLTDHSADIKNFIAGVAQAADQVRSYTDVKGYALGLDAKIWNQDDQAYWTKYYNGVQQGDAHLGGSMVYNMKDLLNEFGLQGGTDVYREVYNTYRDTHHLLYGKELDGTPTYQEAVDKEFMIGVLSDHPELMEGKALAVNYAATMTTKVSSKSVQINFPTGSAVINPNSYPVLDGVYSEAVASEGLKVGVYGHTDNVGNAEKNQSLSEARAESVKQYLIRKGLPEERIESKGYGDQQPLEDNGTAAGRAKNRRVEIAQGQ